MAACLAQVVLPVAVTPYRNTSPVRAKARAMRVWTAPPTNGTFVVVGGAVAGVDVLEVVGGVPRSSRGFARRTGFGRDVVAAGGAAGFSVRSVSGDVPGRAGVAGGAASGAVPGSSPLASRSRSASSSSSPGRT